MVEAGCYGRLDAMVVAGCYVEAGCYGRSWILW